MIKIKIELSRKELEIIEIAFQGALSGCLKEDEALRICLLLNKIVEAERSVEKLELLNEAIQ
jgi:hypothetical protein